MDRIALPVLTQATYGRGEETKTKKEKKKKEKKK
jgi:hypothetical protein